jgi:hypothetical protein
VGPWRKLAREGAADGSSGGTRRAAGVATRIRWLLWLFRLAHQDDDEDDGPIEEEAKPKWYRRSAVRWFVGGVTVSLCLVVAGLLLQLGKIVEVRLAGM